MQKQEDLYYEFTKRLWEKLEQHKEKIDISCACFKQPFLIDQLVKVNPFVKKLVKEVEQECNYQISEDQVSLAVRQFIYAKGHKSQKVQ